MDVKLETVALRKSINQNAPDAGRKPDHYHALQIIRTPNTLGRILLRRKYAPTPPPPTQKMSLCCNGNHYDKKLLALCHGMTQMVGTTVINIIFTC